MSIRWRWTGWRRTRPPPGVRLHVWQSGRDGRLDGAAIRAAVPDWRSASLWFCGPAPFGRSLRADFLRHGLASGDIHQELFQMR